MKYGVIMFKKTTNIGDDIQTYAASRFLDKIDYVVSREEMNSFIPEKKEIVNVIMNGWFLHEKYRWPLSPYIKPLFVATHLTESDPVYGLKYEYLEKDGLKPFLDNQPVGCRDYSTLKVLQDRGVDAYFSGCLTLTVDKFENIKSEKVIYAVDVEKEIVDKIKTSTTLRVEEVTHNIDPTENDLLSFEERMKNVEELLKKYQSSQLVITSRLHCALPCLALGIPVILIFYDHAQDRMGTYLELVENYYVDDFLSKEFNFDKKRKNSDKYITTRELAINSCKNILKSAISDSKLLPDIKIYNHVQEKFNFERQLLLLALKKKDNVINSIKKEVNNNDNYNVAISINQELKNNYDSLFEKNKQLENEIEKMNNYNEVLHNSKSWKILSGYLKIKNKLIKIWRSTWKKP